MDRLSVLLFLVALVLDFYRGFFVFEETEKVSATTLSSCQFYPFITADGRDGESMYTGLSIDLLNILADVCNFSYTLVLPPDGEYGDHRDGRWTGLIGQLQRKEIDLTVAALSITEERSKAVDFTVPYYYATTKIAIRKESPKVEQWRVFHRPFHWQVYLMLLAAFVFCLLLVMCMVTSGNRTLRHRPPLSLVKVTELMFGSALQEAMAIQWIHGPLRVFFAAWCLMSLALSSCYVSKLTSLLVETGPSSPFASLADMVERGDYRWGVMGGTRLLTHLRLSRDPDMQAAYQGLMSFAQDDPEVLSYDLEVHLAKVLEGRYAFFTDSVTVGLWEGEHCEVVGLLEKVLGESLWAFHTQKNSSLTAPLSMILLRLHDTGVMSYLRDKWLPSQTGCQDDHYSPPVITLETVQGPFYMTLAAAVGAAGVLLVERGISWHLGRRKHLEDLNEP